MRIRWTRGRRRYVLINVKKANENVIEKEEKETKKQEKVVVYVIMVEMETTDNKKTNTERR